MREFDLSGTFHFLKESKRDKPIKTGYASYCNTIGEDRLDSFKIWFMDKEWINPGEKCKSNLTFLFSSSEKFDKIIEIDKILEIHEGPFKIAEFVINKIFNEKLKKSTQQRV